jgi:hypothetical protein
MHQATRMHHPEHNLLFPEQYPYDSKEIVRISNIFSTRPRGCEVILHQRNPLFSGYA